MTHDELRALYERLLTVKEPLDEAVLEAVVDEEDGDE